MEEILRKIEPFVRELRAIERWGRHEYGVTRDRVDRILHRPLSVRVLVENYLLYSTIASLFMAELLFHRGIDVFAGYPIVVVNTAILLALNRLVIHRNHAIFLGLVMLVSLIAARRSGTPATAIAQQIAGILVFSVYYISMLTTYGLSVPRWLEIYTKAAVLVAIWGIIDLIGRTLDIFPQTGQTRLHSILPEPSFFVYLTLPAIGVYLNAHLRKGGYLPELALFFLCYLLAESTLGYVALVIVGFFAFLPRLNFWRMSAFAIFAAGALVAAFFLSANVRIRVIDTALGLAGQGFQHLNPTSFAFLANGYVALTTFLKHPFIGVGIGGYLNQYQQYLPILSNDDPRVVTLNMYDAASLYFRTAAELGAFGLISLFGFLIVCARVRGDVHVDIRNALLPFLLVRMSRYGAYFSLDLYFFVGLYFLNYLHYRRQIKPRPRYLESAHAV